MRDGVVKDSIRTDSIRYVPGFYDYITQSHAIKFWATARIASIDTVR